MPTRERDRAGIGRLPATGDGMIMTRMVQRLVLAGKCARNVRLLEETRHD